jgi:uncharacterized membrane protein YbaN (DUF454 family)
MSKTKLTRSPEFFSWLNSENENDRYDFTGTSYYRRKQAAKNKKFFAAASIALMIIISGFLVVSLIFYQGIR